MATSPKKRKPPVKKAPAPAKDLKEGDMRKKFAEGRKKASSSLKASSGTLTDRMGEAKNRPNKGPPARIGQARGNLNKATPPKEIRLGGQGGTGRSLTKAAYLDKFKPIPLGDRPKLLAGSANKAANKGLGGFIRGGAVVTALTSIVNPAFMSYKTGGAAGDKYSDKPSGELFSPAKNRAAGKGNPKAVNPYQAAKAKIPARGEARGGMKSTLESYGASKAAKSVASNSYFTDVPSYKGTKAPISMAGGGVNKPESKSAVPKPKARPARSARSAAVAPKPKARPSVAPAKAMTFQTAVRRNETEAYTRNKMRPKGNLLDLVRRKK